MNNKKSVSSHRSSLLQKNILASFVIKGWSALIVLLLVPATLNCLGEYKNGIWLTISSLLLWIDNMDIGVPYLAVISKSSLLFSLSDQSKSRVME